MKKVLSMMALLAASLSASMVTAPSNANPTGGGIPSKVAVGTSLCIGGHRELTSVDLVTGGCADADGQDATANALSTSLPIDTAGSNGGDLGNISLAGVEFLARQDIALPTGTAITVTFKVCNAANATGCTSPSGVQIVNDGPSYDLYSSSLTGLVSEDQLERRRPDQP